MKKKLRLLLWEDCDRKCRGCCNKQWDLKTLPVCTSYQGYDEVILTGGEPLLHAARLNNIIMNIKKVTNTPIYLYTAKVDGDPFWPLITLDRIQGMTVTLHKKEDVPKFVTFHHYLSILNRDMMTKSLRLNIFKGIPNPLPYCADGNIWKVKENITWIEECSLPNGEVFLRYDQSDTTKFQEI